MSIKSDRWIRRMAREHRMIEPFVDGQVRVYHPGSFIGVILADAGLQRPATQQSPDEVWSEIPNTMLWFTLTASRLM